MKYLAKFVTKDNLNISIDFEVENEKEAKKIVRDFCVNFTRINLGIVYVFFSEFVENDSEFEYEFFGNLNKENLPTILDDLK